MSRRLLLAPAAAMLLALLGAGSSLEWAPKKFPISFWCGPPDPYITVERYKQLTDAGFTVVMPPCEGSDSVERNHRILDTSRAAGVKAFVRDSRMPVSITGVADAKSRLDAIVSDYAKHPALGGYFLVDEPNASSFSGLAEVVAYLRERDPVHPAFINLLPGYATAEQLGTPLFESYISSFASTVKPFAIAFDHYNFLKNSDRPEFFSDLDTVRTASKAAGTPFWQTVLVTPHGGYRSLSEGEKRWEAMQTLAYGSKGLLYFTYWTPADKSFNWGPALIGRDGNPTPQFEEIKRINADVQAMGKYLLDAVPSAVFQAGNVAPGAHPREAGTPVVLPDGGDITVGLFLRDTHLYVMFANRNYKAASEADALLTTGDGQAQQLERASGKWLPVKGSKTDQGDLRTRLKLAAGDAELLRW